MAIYEISPTAAGERLDRALGAIFSKIGLRGRRRMLKSGLVTINGRSVSAAYRVKAGDRIEFPLSSDEAAPPEASLLAVEKDYCFLFKPAGMHTVSLAGKPGISLQALLPAIVPYPLKLLQRLDYGTSGIVCGARTEIAADSFRTAECSGLCGKYYLALLEGALEKKQYVKNRLYTSGRKRSRFLHEAGEVTRHTSFIPVEAWPDFYKFSRELNLEEPQRPSRPVTLAICAIRRGQRHQIRAHAAALGYPLWGDALYGGLERGHFFLEHFFLKFPGHAVSCAGGRTSFLARLPAHIQRGVWEILRSEHR